MSDRTIEQIENEFRRQIRLCAALGTERMVDLVAEAEAVGEVTGKGWSAPFSGEYDAHPNDADVPEDAPPKCRECGGTRKIERETRAPQLDGRSAVLRYVEDCPVCARETPDAPRSEP